MRKTGQYVLLAVMAAVTAGLVVLALQDSDEVVADDPPSTLPSSPEPTLEPPELWAGADLDVRFTGLPDGPPGEVVPDAPDFVLNHGVSGGPAATPVVRDGALTVESEIGAGYTQVKPRWAPRSIGATFRFRAGGPTGAICLAFWDGLIPEPFAVPNSRMHFVVTPVNWIYGLWEGGEFEQIASGNLAQPLVTDGVTTYTTQVAVDGDTATITLPDGSRQAVTDPRIGSIAGDVLNWETYLNQRGDAHGEFTRIWAGR